MNFNDREFQALKLFNKFDTDTVKVEPGNLSEAISIETAQALHKKGCVTIAACKPSGFETVLTVYGKKVCDGLNNNESKEMKGDDQMSEESINTENEATENTSQDEVEYLTVKEAAELFGCTYPNMCGHISRGNLEKLKVNGKGVVRKADVLELKSQKGTRRRKKKVASAEPVQQVQTESVTTETTIEETISEPEEEVSLVVPDVPVPSIPTVTEVELGTELILIGKVWVKKPTDAAYSTQDVDTITVEVVSRHPTDKGIWLICQPAGSDVYMAVYESEVLSGKYQMVTPQEKLALRDAEMEKARGEFRSSLTRFVDARDKKLEAGKIFTKVDKAERPVIDGYVRTYGQESKEGKQDFLVSEMGYDTHLVRTPGKAVTTHKEDEMVAWMEANGYDDCIKKVPDINMWNNLKAAKKVPAEVIDSLEEMTVTEDRFSLTVKKSSD